MTRSVGFLAMAAAIGIAGIAVAQVSAPARIRGEVVSFAHDTLTVHQNNGDTVAIAMKPGTKVSAVRKIALSEIKPGSFIGTAAAPDAKGNLMAQEVVVFPESERGTGEGHYAWDLGPKSTMTNANVDAVVKATNGNQLQLSYKGGTNTVTVPPNAPVVTFISADRTDLVAGRKVFVIASGDASKHLTAQRIVVEKDGVPPPM